MTPEYDDLEELLRQNLELRRKLGSEAARATGVIAQQSSRRLPSSAVEGVDAVSDKNELEGLRRELMLRRGPVAEVAKAEDRGGTEGSAEAASENDGLGVLRQNLKARRELGSQVTKVNDGRTKQDGGIVYASGWGLYWTFLAIAGVSAFLMLRLTGEWHFSDATLIAASVSALVLYGLGRDFLYVLSGK